MTETGMPWIGTGPGAAGATRTDRSFDIQETTKNLIFRSPLICQNVMKPLSPLPPRYPA